jgi:hypothetical protein
MLKVVALNHATVIVPGGLPNQFERRAQSGETSWCTACRQCTQLHTYATKRIIRHYDYNNIMIISRNLIEKSMILNFANVCYDAMSCHFMIRLRFVEIYDISLVDFSTLYGALWHVAISCRFMVLVVSIHDTTSYCQTMPSHSTTRYRALFHVSV